MKNPFIVVKRKSIFVLIICFVLIFSHTVLYLNIDGYKKVIDSFSKQIFNSFSGSDKDTIDNDDNIFFVFNANEYINLGTKKPTLLLPSKEEYELSNGVFTFSLKNNITIKSAGSGIVKKVGFLENGLKYIEIRHSGGIITRYENLKIVGVGENFNVSKVHIIATAEKETPFVFKILKNEKVTTNYEVLDGEIKWQK